MEIGDEDLDEVIFGRLQTLVESARTIKNTSRYFTRGHRKNNANNPMIRKLLRRVEEVINGSGSLRPEIVESLQSASVNTHSIAVFASEVSRQIHRVLCLTNMELRSCRIL
jgi:hypothetical protein